MRRSGVRIPSAPPCGNPVRPVQTRRPGRGSLVVVRRHATSDHDPQPNPPRTASTCIRRCPRQPRATHPRGRPTPRCTSCAPRPPGSRQPRRAQQAAVGDPARLLGHRAAGRAGGRLVPDHPRLHLRRGVGVRREPCDVCRRAARQRHLRPMAAERQALCVSPAALLGRGRDLTPYLPTAALAGTQPVVSDRPEPGFVTFDVGVSGRAPAPPGAFMCGTCPSRWATSSTSWQSSRLRGGVGLFPFVTATPPDPRLGPLGPAAVGREPHRRIHVVARFAMSSVKCWSGSTNRG
jgi:hypothetical protein